MTRGRSIFLPCRVRWRPPRQAVRGQAKPILEYFGKLFPSPWELALPAVMRANASPPAVFTSAAAAADYGAHQTPAGVRERRKTNAPHPPDKRRRPTRTDWYTVCLSGGHYKVPSLKEVIVFF